MSRFKASPREILASFWRHRHLLKQMVYRDVMGRYRGSFLGIVWSLFNPILMLSVYTFVFSVVFKARWNTSSDSKTEFAIALFVGMIVFNVFSECINRSPSLILSHPNYVKKVVFPLEILPWVPLGSALFHAAVSLFVLLCFSLSVHGSIPWTIIFFPIVITPLVLFVQGLSWFLSALGVYLRDVGQTVGMLSTILMFLSPVFYPLTALPENFRTYMDINPMAFIIESARDVLIWGKIPNLLELGIYFAITSIIATLGFAWFQRTRSGFSDVI